MRHFWRIGILILWGILSCPVHAADCFLAPDGLIALWNAENGGNDLIGGSNGVLESGAVIRGGKVSQGFGFDGSAGRVSLGTSPELELENFTIHAWVRRSVLNVTSLSNPGAGIIFSGSEGGYGFGFTTEGNLLFGIIGVTSIVSGFGVADLEWHHVALTKSGPIARFYLDGVAGPELSTDFSTHFKGPFSIGALGTPYRGQWFSLLGSLDEVAVYNRALSPGDLQQIAAAGDKQLCASIRVLRFGQTSYIGRVGEVLPVELLFRNVGQNLLSNSKFILEIPKGLELVSFRSNRGACTLKDGVLGCDFETLSPGAEVALQMEVRSSLKQILEYSARFSAREFGANKVSGQARTILDFDRSCSDLSTLPIHWWQAEGSTVDTVEKKSGSFEGELKYGAGKVGQAFVLDGKSQVDLGAQPTLFEGEFTVDFWVKRSDTGRASLSPSGAGALFAGTIGSAGIAMDGGGHLFVTHVGITSTPVFGAIADDQWHHVAVTRSVFGIGFFIDGASVGSAIFPPVFEPPSNVSIGALGIAFQGDRFRFLGAMDEVAVYNKALRADEIRALYSMQSLGRCQEDISLTFVEPLPGFVGEAPVPVRLAVANTGNSSARLVRLQIPLQRGQSIVGEFQPAGACRVAGAEVVCEIPELESGHSVLIEGVVQYSLPGLTRFVANLSRLDREDLFDSNNVLDQAIIVQLDCLRPLPGLLHSWPGDGNGWDLAGSANADSTNVTFDVGLRAAQAFQFRGDGSLSVTDVDLGLQTNGFAWSLWIKPEQRTAGLMPILDAQGALSALPEILTRLAIRWPIVSNSGNGTLVYEVLPPPFAISTEDWVDSGVEIPLGRWSHVALTLDSQPKVNLYVNGSLAISSKVAGPRDTVPAAVIRFGAWLPTSPIEPSASGFHGALQDLEYYQRPLLVDEVSRLYETRRLTRCTEDLSLLWTQAVPVLGVGESGTFQLKVRKNGAAAMAKAVVQVEIPKGLDILQATMEGAACGVTNQLVTCTIESLKGNSEREMALELRAGAEPSEFQTLKAVVSETASEFSSLNNQASFVVEIAKACSELRGLVAWISLDDEVGDRVGGAVLTPGQWRRVPGRKGLGIQSLGKSGVEIEGTQHFPVGDLTVDFWIRRGDMVSVGRESPVVSLLEGKGGAWSIGITQEGALTFGATSLTRIDSRSVVRDLAWHHVAVKKERTRVGFYLDGELVGESTFNQTLVVADHFLLGGGSGSGSFLGTLDEVGIYDRGLSQEEIRSLFGVGGKGRCFADLALAMDPAAAQLRAGDPLNLRYVVQNRADRLNVGSRFSLALPTGFSVLASTNSGGACVLDHGRLDCGLGSIAPGQVVEIVVRLATASTVEFAEIDAGLISTDFDAVTANDFAKVEVELTGECSAMPGGMVAWWRGESTPLEFLGKQSTLAVPDLLIEPRGRVGTAYKFGDARHLRVEQPVGLVHSNFTFASWVRPESRDGVVDVIAMSEWESLPDFCFGLGIRGIQSYADGIQGTIPVGNLCFAIEQLSGLPRDFSIWTDARVAIPLNRWSHVALTVDAEFHTVAVFVNGVETRRLAFLSGELKDGPGCPFILAGRANTYHGGYGNSDFFDGLMDEVMIFKRALVASELKAMVDAGASGMCSEDLSVTSESRPSGPVPVGYPMTIPYRVTNLGHTPVTGVVLHQFLSDGLFWIPPPPAQGHSEPFGTAVDTLIGTLSAGASVEVELKFEPTRYGAHSISTRVIRDGDDLSLVNNSIEEVIQADTQRFISLGGLQVPAFGESNQVAHLEFALYPAPREPVQVQFATADGTAHAGEDYVSKRGSATIGPDQYSFPVDVSLVQDSKYEGVETFQVELQVQSVAGLIRTNVTVQLFNFGPPPSVSIVGSRAIEGTGTNRMAEVLVQIHGATQLSVRLDFETLNGTARTPTDYARTQGTLVIAPGETEKRIQIPIVGDSVPEQNEYFLVQFSNPVGCVLERTVAVVSILDDDRDRGELDRFEWTVPETPSGIPFGQSFPAEIRALDSNGQVVPGFTGTIQIDAAVGSFTSSPLIVSEVRFGPEYGVELMNITSDPVDVSGWTIFLFDDRKWPVPQREFTIPQMRFLNSMESLTLTRTQASVNESDVHFGLGEELDWAPVAAGLPQRPWSLGVLLQDPSGQIRDSLFAGDAKPIDNLWPRPLTEEDWAGKTMPVPTAAGGFIRTRVEAVPGASQWLLSAGNSFGQANPELELPLSEVRSLKVAPDTAAIFAAGGTKLEVSVTNYAPVLRLHATDGNGHEGYSKPIHLSTPDDVAVQIHVDPPLGDLRQLFHFQVVVTNPGPSILKLNRMSIRPERGSSVGFGSLQEPKNSHGAPPRLELELGNPVILADLEELAPGTSAEIEFRQEYHQELPALIRSLSFTVQLSPIATDLHLNNNLATTVVEVGPPCAVLNPAPFGWWSGLPDGVELMGLPSAGVHGSVTVGGGRVGDGYHFGNSGGAMTLDAASKLKVPLEEGRCIELWLRTSAEESRDRIVLLSKWNAALSAGYRLEMRRGLPAFVVGNGVGAQETVWIGRGGPVLELRDGRWHHLALVLQRAGANSTFYIDGVASGVFAPVLWDRLLDTEAPLVLGASSPTDYSDAFAGDLDEIVFGSALASKLVETVYQAGGHGRCAGQLSARGSWVPVGTPEEHALQLSMAVSNQGPATARTVRLRVNSSVAIKPLSFQATSILSIKAIDLRTLEYSLAPIPPGSTLMVTANVVAPGGSPEFALTTVSDWPNLRHGDTVLMESSTTISIDRDDDGMEDAWEVKYGLDPTDPKDAFGDPDQDGATNLQEYLAGTGPKDPKSVFRIWVQNRPDGGVEITWPVVAGKAYQVVRQAPLGALDWEVLGEVLAEVDSDREFVDLAPRAVGSFYAVRILP